MKNVWLFLLLFSIFLSFNCGGGGGEGESYVQPGSTGKAIIGNLGNADVKIFKVEGDGSLSLLWTGKTSSGETLDEIGNFDTHADELTDDSLYIYQVCGGYDWDVDDNGIKDEVPTENNGCIRAVVLGREVKEVGNRFIVSSLTEFQYRWIARFLKYNYSRDKLLNERNRIAEKMLLYDLNGDNSIDQKDIIIFNPKTDSQKVHPLLLAQGEDFIDALHRDDPFIPRMAGSVSTVDILNGKDILIDGNYAFTIWPFTILDISDPFNPAVVHKIETVYGEKLFKSGNFVYIADRNRGIHIIDVSDISNPVVKSRFYLSGAYFTDIYISGDYAYAVDKISGLKIIDVSDKSNPVLISSFPISENIYSISGKGNYLYIGGDRYLHIIDITDINNPIEEKKLNTGRVYSIDISGNYLYISGYSLGIYNIADPSNPALESVIPVYSKDTYVRENVLFSAGPLRVYLFDISDKKHPQEVGQIPTGIYDKAVSVKDNFVFVAGDKKIKVLSTLSGSFNQNDFKEPVIVKEISTTGAKALDIKGGFLYVADTNSLKIFDISDPVNLSLKGRLLTGALDIFVDGNYGYISGGVRGFFIADISDKTNPSIVSSISTVKAFSAYKKGSYVYLAGGGSRYMYIVDVSDILNPSVIFSFNVENSVYDVYVQDRYAFVAGAGSGLKILDISDPLNPSPVLDLDTDSAHGIFVSDGYLYLADGNGGLKIFDISDVPSSRLVGSVGTGHYAWKSYVYDRFSFVADGFGGVQIIDISNKNEPEVVEFINTKDYAFDVSVFGNYMYIADGKGGILVVDMDLYDELE